MELMTALNRLHGGKNIKLPYFIAQLSRYAVPKVLLRSRLEEILRDGEKRYDMDYVLDRVNYYNRLTGSATPSPTMPRGLKLGKIGKTFDNLRRRSEEPQQIIETATNDNDTGDRQEFTNEQLLTQWTSMCNRMPQQMTGIAARMKNMAPVITSFPDIEVVVDNQILLDDIMKIKGRIRNTLVLALKNSAITLNIRLAKPEEIKPILTNKERFDELKRENKAFEKLSEMLKLEIN